MLSACRAPVTSNPETSYRQIYADFLRGNLDSAAQAAAAQETNLLVADPSWSFRFRLLQAEILQYQGKSQDIADILDPRAFAFVPTDDLEIKRLTLLCLADARLGRPQQSAQELQQAQRLSLATHSKLQGEVLRTEGLLELRNGSRDQAENSFRRSLALARQQNDDYLAAGDLLNLGYISLQTEHLDEALDRFNASSQLSAKISANVLLQGSLGNAGWAYYALGDFERALESFRQAEEQARRQRATDSVIVWLQSEGQALSQLGDLKQAQSCYEQAVAAAETNHVLRRQAQNETALALLSLRRGQLDAASAQAQAALRDARQLQDHPDERNALLAQALIAAAARAPHAEDLLAQISTDVSTAPSVRWTAENALANLYAARNLPARAEQSYRNSIRTFETQRNSVQESELRLPFSANGDDLYHDYAELLIQTGRSTEALYLLDNARAMSLKEEFRDREQAGRTSIRTASTRHMSGSQIVLFYSLGPQKSYLWAIDRRGPHLRQLPPATDIAAHIQAYQASILKSRDPLQEANADGQWLYKNLVGSAESLIPPGARVLIVPDGPLNSFNLETLLKPGPAGLHYWIDDVSLTAASSLRVLSSTPRARQPHRADAETLLLIGDPLPATNEYESLPHASEEVEDIERYFPLERRTTLTQAAAVPDAYSRSRPGQYTYLHFVAHGVASSLRPLDSAIVLSPSPADADRYKLYAREIVQQPIHARLVTLSACYGSGVRNYAGEGLVGLSWAFLHAGAQQVIAALWQVNDSSTPKAMDQMYRRLTEGAAPDEALRSAKLTMLHSNGVFRKPLSWAAFQLYQGS